jgi:hypothetical protein
VVKPTQGRGSVPAMNEQRETEPCPVCGEIGHKVILFANAFRLTACPKVPDGWVVPSVPRWVSDLPTPPAS